MSEENETRSPLQGTPEGRVEMTGAANQPEACPSCGATGGHVFGCTGQPATEEESPDPGALPDDYAVNETPDSETVLEFPAG